ncbi:MarR family transcriptional regulator [Actinomadura nitritigenes]|uniref:MarR family transcriptional regulator n=1 Tax=Actinomadura nitritigenes TaxID=134602 RepID=A0ABS3RFF9_9ACTN|nr:MarR family transcriptional regulator [Actinomadura nitritigenes]MBO2444972.1 MarR family transcriptional regulator [Actinomadura nitritigenes]
MDDLFADPRLTTMGLLFEAHEGLLTKLEPVFKEHGISGLDLNALTRLSRSPGRRLRMSDLATQTSLSTSGITRLVDRLARAGLVERAPCPDDRRTIFTVLTPSGADRLAAVLPDYLAVIDRWFTGLLTPEQLTAVVDGLRIIRDAARPEATHTSD